MEIAVASAEVFTSFVPKGFDFSHPQVWMTLSRRLSYIWAPLFDRRLCVPCLAFLSTGTVCLHSCFVLRCGASR